MREPAGGTATRPADRNLPERPPLPRRKAALPRPVAWSVLFRPHDGQDGFSVVPGAADGLEADERRGSLAVVVADVQGEQHHAPAVLPGDGTAQQFDSAGRSPARLVFRTVHEA